MIKQKNVCNNESRHGVVVYVMMTLWERWPTCWSCTWGCRSRRGRTSGTLAGTSGASLAPIPAVTTATWYHHRALGIYHYHSNSYHSNTGYTMPQVKQKTPITVRYIETITALYVLQVQYKACLNHKSENCMPDNRLNRIENLHISQMRRHETQILYHTRKAYL